MSFSFYCSFSLSGIANGTGQHVWDLTKEANAEARKVSGHQTFSVFNYCPLFEV